MNMAQERGKYNSLGYFNLARGLGMLLILFGHSISPFFPKTSEELSSSLFSGAGSVLGGGIMAMFFMISGFGFYTRSPKKCLSIQFKLLLKPYFQVSIAILAIKLILALVKQRSFLLNGGELVPTLLLGLNAEGGGNFGGIPIESVSILWFLLALFTGWVIYNGISRLKNAKLQWCLIGLCVVLSWMLCLVSDVWPYCIPHGLLAAGYLAAGSEIKKYRLLERKLPLWCWAVVIATALVSTAFGSVNIVACHWQLGLLDIVGSFCVGFLLLRLYGAVMNRAGGGLWVQLTESVGLHSIWIVCLHAFEKMVLPWYRLKVIFPDNPVLCTAICFFGRCAVIWLLFELLTLGQRLLRNRKRKRIIIET